MTDTRDQFEQAMTGELEQRAAGLAIKAVAEAIQVSQDLLAELESGRPGDHVPLEAQRLSVGYVCQQLQISPLGCRITMEEAGVKFVGSRNGIPEIDGLGFEKIVKHVVGLRLAVAEERRQKEAAK